MKKYFGLAFATMFIFAGCMTAQEHATDVRKGMDEGDRLTVGTVQREIKKGMPNAEVIQILGSPNIVSTDEKGREVWVYDKIATDRVYSTSSGGLSVLGLAGGAVGGAIVGGGVSPSYSRGAGAESTSQRTLTIIIKYDEQGKVRECAYHSSKF